MREFDDGGDDYVKLCTEIYNERKEIKNINVYNCLSTSSMFKNLFFFFFTFNINDLLRYIL